MNFEFIKYLWVLIIIPAMIILLVKSFKISKSNLEKFTGSFLVNKMAPGMSFKLKKYKMAIIVIAFLFLIFALSGPQIGSKLMQVNQKGIDVFVAVDCSASMDAEDIKPSRMANAKIELESLIDKLKGNRIGLIAFAGAAFMQCPLTLDITAVSMFLNDMSTKTVPHSGTAIGDAIRLGIKSFPENERTGKVIVLLSDGEDHDTDPIGAANEAKKNGIRIYTIGIGTVQGEPIPVKDENGNNQGFKKDANGNTVLSRLNENQLKQIAKITGGDYYRFSYNQTEVDSIYNDIMNLKKKELKGKFYQKYQNRYVFFILFALILIILEYLIPERRFLKNEESI